MKRSIFEGSAGLRDLRLGESEFQTFGAGGLGFFAHILETNGSTHKARGEREREPEGEDDTPRGTELPRPPLPDAPTKDAPVGSVGTSGGRYREAQQRTNFECFDDHRRGLLKPTKIIHEFDIIYAPPPSWAPHHSPKLLGMTFLLSHSHSRSP